MTIFLGRYTPFFLSILRIFWFLNWYCYIIQIWHSCGVGNMIVYPEWASPTPLCGGSRGGTDKACRLVETCRHKTLKRKRATTTEKMPSQNASPREESSDFTANNPPLNTPAAASRPPSPALPPARRRRTRSSRKKHSCSSSKKYAQQEIIRRSDLKWKSP